MHYLGAEAVRLNRECCRLSQWKCAQLEIFADIARLFRSREMRRKAVEVENYTEFLALLNAEHNRMPK